MMDHSSLVMVPWLTLLALVVQTAALLTTILLAMRATRAKLDHKLGDLERRIHALDRSIAKIAQWSRDQERICLQQRTSAEARPRRWPWLQACVSRPL